MSQLSLGLALTNPSMNAGVPSAVVNLLDGQTPVAGANTTLGSADDQHLAIRNGANPRIYWTLTGLLTIGATYRLLGGIWKRNSTFVVLRVANTTAISTDGPYDTGLLSADTSIDATFVADANSDYLGLVGVNNSNGQAVGIDEDFRLEYVSGP